MAKTTIALIFKFPTVDTVKYRISIFILVWRLFKFRMLSWITLPTLILDVINERSQLSVKVRLFGYHFWTMNVCIRYSVSHIITYPYLFAGYQGNHQNFEKSLVFHKLWLIWIRLKQKKKTKNLEKKIQNGRLKKTWVFQPPPKAEQFSPKFHRLVLGFIGLIDAKGINVTQPIWPSGCLT